MLYPSHSGYSMLRDTRRQLASSDAAIKPLFLSQWNRFFMSTELVDNFIFERFCNVLKDKAYKHFDLLTKESDLLIQQLRRQDREGVVFSAHKIRSAAGQLGAVALSRYVGHLERQFGGEGSELAEIAEENVNHAEADALELQMHSIALELTTLTLRTRFALEQAFKARN